MVLERLTPERRVAFVLHDALAVPFAEIADVLGCSVATARQHASRARRAVAEADPPPRVGLDEQHVVLEAFLAALATGDVPAVTALLHPAAVVLGDGGGRERTAAGPSPARRRSPGSCSGCSSATGLRGSPPRQPRCWSTATSACSSRPFPATARTRHSGAGCPASRSGAGGSSRSMTW